MFPFPRCRIRSGIVRRWSGGWSRSGWSRQPSRPVKRAREIETISVEKKLSKGKLSWWMNQPFRIGCSMKSRKARSPWRGGSAQYAFKVNYGVLKIKFYIGNFLIHKRKEISKFSRSAMIKWRRQFDQDIYNNILIPVLRDRPQLCCRCRIIFSCRMSSFRRIDWNIAYSRN